MTFLFFVVLIAVSIPVYGHVTKTLTYTYQTTVVEKNIRNLVIYIGFIMPIATHIITVDMGVEVNVDRATYERLEVGDPVLLEKYSNGTYRIGAG